MNIVYVIAIVIGIFELIGIRVSMAKIAIAQTNIAVAYLLWAQSIEKDSNPGVTIDTDDPNSANYRPKGRPEAPA